MDNRDEKLEITKDSIDKIESLVANTKEETEMLQDLRYALHGGIKKEILINTGEDVKEIFLVDLFNKTSEAYQSEIAKQLIKL